MKKVRGEVNPADLFTKHLPSREKVHQLLKLFGCEYRDGRAAAAPLLRPHGPEDRQGGHSTFDPLPTFVAELEAQLHDPDVLPHMYPKVDIDKMFPTIPAAAGPQNAEDYVGGYESELRDARCYSRTSRDIVANSSRGLDALTKV